MSQEPPMRRSFLLSAAAGIAGAALGQGAAAMPPARQPGKPLAILNTRQVRTRVLDIGYHEAGPTNGRPLILLHGYPYDIHSYADVAPLLAAQGYRVIVPHLRGHGSTRFLDAATPRSGQQAALGQDVLDLMDALQLPEALIAGYDWGGHAACAAAVLQPERCVGLVSVNSYLIHDISSTPKPLPPQIEASIWFQFYFQSERGRNGLEANRDQIARLLWERNSPKWRFDDATFERTARAFTNPEYVPVVIDFYRHRFGAAAGDPAYAAQQARLAGLPVITVPAITLDGNEDGVISPGDGRDSAHKFSGPRTHRRVAGAGHNVPQEAPQAFADAVAGLAHNVKWRS